MAGIENYYALLGIPYDSTTDEIRIAYREIARRVHPDISKNPATSEQFIQLQKAFEVLSDADRRYAYDSSLPHNLIASPISIHTFFSRRTIPSIAEPQLVYSLARLSLPLSSSIQTIPPLNVCLVLDSSTSMQGIILDRVKATAIEIVRGLKPEDILSVVAFHDRAEVLAPAVPNLDRQRIEAAIRMLQPGGGTEMFNGLEAALAEVKRHRNMNFINHIILLTDGRTYGDELACEELAKQAASVRIGISGLGIGQHWNDAFIDRLAAISGGSSMYISKAEEVRKFLKEKFSGLERIYAEHIEYNFELPPGVQLRYAFRLQPESSVLETSSPLQIGFIHFNIPLDVLFEFMVSPIPENSRTAVLSQGRIKGNVPLRIEPSFSIRMDLTRPVNNAVDTTPAPHIIVQAMSQLTMYRIQERARQDISAGDITEGTRRLQHLATHLLSQGQQDLARMVLREASYIQQHQSFSEEGEKRIKYGTRSLLLPPTISENHL